MSFFTNIRLQSVLLFILAVLLYVNTLGHGFVQDDPVLITHNKWVQEGVNGIPEIFSQHSFSGYLPPGSPVENVLPGGRYRPMALAFFAILVQIFDNNSLVFHLFSVLLYAFCGVLLYRLFLRALQPAAAQQPARMIAWSAALLFVTHPVHTEVVANVKSADELLAMLGALGALYLAFEAVDQRSWRWGLGAGLLYLLACLSKETAVPALLLTPLALWIFRGNSKGAGWRPVLPMAVAFGAYMLARGTALDWNFVGEMVHDPLNNPFLKAEAQQWVPYSPDEQAATVLFVLLQYLRLLVWPHPLTHDYYPFQIGLHTLEEPIVWVSAGLYTALIGLSTWGLLQRKRIAFGTWLYLLALLPVANVFIPVGTFMAERFLFMPSAGFCFAAALLLAWPATRSSRLALPALWLAVLVAAVFGTLTVLRNPAWASDKMLMQTDLKTSPESVKLRNALGTALLTEALQTPDSASRRLYLQQAETHLKLAVERHPSYYDAILALGATVFYLNKYELSIMAYQRALQLAPDDPKPKTGLVYALRYGSEYYAQNQRNPEKAMALLSGAWEISPDTAVATRLAVQYQLAGQQAEALTWLEKALALAPNDTRLRENLSNAYRAAGQPAKAAEVLKRPQSFTTFSPGGSGGK
ncbi:MAG: glycosyltransferase family 39 protein [Saprospirales bacterium]|nr:glycosyltransferase family 39 protein [Saprospirales bacterium]